MEIPCEEKEENSGYTIRKLFANKKLDEALEHWVNLLNK